VKHRERKLEIAGLNTIAIGPSDANATVVLLHGYDMTPSDLAPFGHSLGLPVLFLFPCGPVPSPSGARAWWKIDAEHRTQALEQGPRDLAGFEPREMDTARAKLAHFVSDCARARSPLILGGFSQGAMLALDFTLRGPVLPAALVLLSSSRIALQHWMPRLDRLRGLPVFVSHGRADPDLGFSAGEALRDMLSSAGANVIWFPFEGKHEIPLVVWRGLRKFLRALLT